MAQEVIRRRLNLTMTNPDSPSYKLTRGFSGILQSATDAQLMAFAEQIVKAVPGDQVAQVQLTTTTNVIADGE